jgi:hypothetical protein
VLSLSLYICFGQKIIHGFETSRLWRLLDFFNFFDEKLNYWIIGLFSGQNIRIIGFSANYWISSAEKRHELLDFWRLRRNLLDFRKKTVICPPSTKKCSIFPLAGTPKVLDPLLSLSEVIR